MQTGPIIWIEGLIGAGKTTVTNKLAQALDLRPLFEPVESNPLLSKFYQNPKRYAFPMQMHLLHVRYNLQVLAAAEAVAGQGAILDRGLPGDRVFCRMHIRYGNIDEDLWQVYDKAFNIMSMSLRPPSLLVYLDVSPETAHRRVCTRDRESERGSVSLEYLKHLQEGYEELIDEVESGEHAWSRGIKVLRWGWDEDHLPAEPLIEAIRDAT